MSEAQVQFPALEKKKKTVQETDIKRTLTCESLNMGLIPDSITFCDLGSITQCPLGL